MLIVPDLIEDACVDVLERRHPEHLAALERQLVLDPQTIERLATVDVLAGEGFRLRSDKPPAALLGIFGTVSAPEANKRRRLDVTWTLAVQVVAVGIDRRDTLRRRNWYALTVAECLLNRLPRHAEPVDHIALADIDLVNGAEERSQRTVAEAQLLFDVRVRDTITLNLLPADDTDLEAGTPGGPPATSYGTPVPWPDVGTVTLTVLQEE